jgi:sugar diacid utilization regulator
LEELDRQHQAALEVALTTRTQYQKENRELQEQLLQLVKERDEAQQVRTLKIYISSNLNLNSFS